MGFQSFFNHFRAHTARIRYGTVRLTSGSSTCSCIVMERSRLLRKRQHAKRKRFRKQIHARKDKAAEYISSEDKEIQQMEQLLGKHEARNLSSELAKDGLDCIP